MSSEAKVALIQCYDIGFHRATRNANNELQKFSIEDLRSILEYLQKLKQVPGSSNPCGSVFNRHVGYPVWMRVMLWSFMSLGSVTLLPIQLGAAALLLVRGRFKPIWKELPTPTYELINWAQDMVSFVKAPLHLIKKSIENEAALCVNRNGRFSIKDSGYTVMSHVWGETMGWQKLAEWGPVDLSLRKMGISKAHFLRFFDRCEAEWIWVDVIAMPEVLEDMTTSEQNETEKLRVGIINALHTIYTKADQLVVLDTLLLRLKTRSPVDVAAILSLSFWMTRVWTFVEVKLAKKVTLKTSDFSFDLDMIIEFFGKTVMNDEQRYHALLRRLWPLRDEALSTYPSSTPMEIAYYGCEGRFTDVDIDQARALFPFLDLKWEHGWTLQQGLAEIVRAFPAEKEWVKMWCEYHSIDFEV